MRKPFAILLTVFAIQACSKSNPPPPPPAAAVQPVTPAPMPATPPPMPGAAGAPATAAAVAKPAPDAKKDVLGALKAGQLQEFYNPAGRRDPFKPFEGGAIIYTAVAKAPLERFELNQLELTAIVWGIARPKVLFRAPDGYSYIAQVGTGIGRNRGKITRITKNRVLISEEFRDPSGQYVARESEFEMESGNDSEKLFQDMGMKYSDE